MNQRHADEMMNFQKKMLSKQQQKPKFSTELLSLRKVEEHLAKAKNYSEAQKIKLKADTLEASERKRITKRIQRGLAQHESKFKASKDQELAALRKRIESSRKEHNRKRQDELDR